MTTNSPKTKHSIPGPEDVTRTTLANGITLLIRENHASPTVTLEGALATGSIHDPIGKTGLSNFTSALITRGSERYDFASFNETIESVGGNLAVSGDLDQMNFGITSLSEDFADLVAVLQDVLRHPIFPEEQIELVRRRRLVHLQEREQDTANMAHLRFYETIYGKQHPYGLPTSGYTETVRGFTRQELIDFHAQRFTPHGAVIAITGDVQTQPVIELMQRHLGDWQVGDWQGSNKSKNRRSDSHLAAPPDVTEPQRVDVTISDKIQSDIVLGCRAVPRLHPDFFAVRLANTILGVFGMMGRLGDVVREQQGLAYYSYSSQDASQAAGLWLAAAGVNPSNVQRAIDSIWAEFARLGNEPVSTDELSDSQAYLTGILPLSLETNGGVASALLDMEWLGLGLDYLHRYHGLIYEVSTEDVQRVAQHYLRPERAVLVVAGPS